MQDTVHLALATAESTSRLARLLAPYLVSGDAILLYGPIGSGKTHFARALIQRRLEATGRVEDIPSPTFTLVQTYDDGVVEIWHADLYRLSSPGEVVELGLDEAFDAAITLVEWPDRLGDTGPKRACRIAFAQHGDGRTATIDWQDPRRDPWLAEFREGVPYHE